MGAYTNYLTFVTLFLLLSREVPSNLLLLPVGGISLPKPIAHLNIYIYIYSSSKCSRKKIKHMENKQNKKKNGTKQMKRKQGKKRHNEYFRLLCVFALVPQDFFLPIPFFMKFLWIFNNLNFTFQKKKEFY